MDELGDDPTMLRTAFRDGTLDPDVDLITKPFTVDPLASKARAVLGAA
jgi:hypothetical protein